MNISDILNMTNYSGVDTNVNSPDVRQNDRRQRKPHGDAAICRFRF